MWNFRQIKMDEISKREDSLFEHVSKLIDEARKHVKTTIDTTMVYTYYGVGKYIVEDEQQGETRAKYGKTVLRNLSEKLTKRYGKGWSVETLTAARKFYQIYSEGKIANTVYEIQENADIHFTLSWSHYLILMRIANQNERNIYASAYRLYLPDKALLQAKVKEWIAEFEENEELMKHESNE